MCEHLDRSTRKGRNKVAGKSVAAKEEEKPVARKIPALEEKKVGADLVALTADFDDALLRGIATFEDAVKLTAEVWGGITPAGEHIGNGFSVLPNEQKSRLIGVGFIILTMKMHDGDYGEYASMLIVTANNDRLILNDGSTGIYYQARTLIEVTGKSGGIHVPDGLRLSEYETCAGERCGIPRPTNVSECKRCGDTQSKRGRGQTYYFDAA